MFTFVWYAFPGKFISYRENQDFTTRYPKVYMDPDNLLKNSMGDMTLFEDPALEKKNSVNDDGAQNKENSATTTTSSLYPKEDDLIINREVQRFNPTVDDSAKYFAKPTIEF